MIDNRITHGLKALALTLSLVAASDAMAQVSVNLTAQRMSLALPDGKTTPMWGFCATTACSGSWAPGPTITVPVGQSLTINLTNSLPTPTSIVILGQTGGGLGSPKTVTSPQHATKTQTTWPANNPAAVSFVPPAQGPRVQSFGTETSAGGGTQTYTWPAMKAGTYLYETGTNPSIQAPMGLYGVVVVTNAPTGGSGGTALVPGAAYPGAFSSSTKIANVAYDADAVMLLSEVDLAQNTAVDGLCPAAPAACTSIDPMAYPPAVNYAPTYFLINGQPFSRANPTGFPVGNSSVSGNVLLRFANAGLRTHIPSVVGLSMSLMAEDGNILPGNPKVQNEVLLTAGKTYDVVVNPPTGSSTSAYAAKSYGVFDRELSLSAGNTADSGMQAFLEIAGAALPTGVQPKAVADTFTVPANVTTFSGNVLQNDVAVYSAKVSVPPTAGTVAMNLDGSFTYTSSGTISSPVTFSYCGNGASAGSASLCANVTLTASAATGAPVALPDAFSSRVATYLRVPHPGVLANDTDPAGYSLTAKADPSNPLPSTVTLNPDGSFIVTGATASFSYIAVNSQGTPSKPATVSLSFPKGSGLTVSVVDAQSKAPITDYRWTIEEDTTYKNDAAVNSGTPPNVLAVNFHKSFMPVVAAGCIGDLSCGVGQKYSSAAAPRPPDVDPMQVALDPTKHYFISVLPGDAANAFINGGGAPVPIDPNNAGAGNRQFDPSKDCTAAICGHTMGGATIDPGQLAVTVLAEPNPLPTAQISVFIFEDNNPTNGDIDGVEEAQGLGGFQIIINDVGGRTGDPIGQMTYDAFNYPLTNALMGTPGCPAPSAANGKNATLQGMVITCPDGIDPATGVRYALAGHALIKNLMPGRFDVIANPGADRAAVGQHWVQTSTLEGTRGQDAFTGVGEPAYFQEFGPPGFHSFIGFVDTVKLEQRHATVAAAAAAAGGKNNTITGSVGNEHMSRPTNEALFTGSYAPLAQSHCYIGLNSQSGNGENIAFSPCNPDGTFTIANVPDGAYQLVTWDEWLDQIIGFTSVTVAGGQTVNLGAIQSFSWFTKLETNTFLDNDGKHKPSAENDGLSQVQTMIRFRDGSISNVLNTDATGNATFSELFPLFNWYVTESDQTRFTGNAVHVVVDGGGKPDTAGTFAGVLNSKYPTGESTERVDPGTVRYEGLQGFISQTAIIDWAKRPYTVGENGGIQGVVIYASTRPFDDPALGTQNIWEPLVPRVPVNLYQETTAPDGTSALKFITQTTTSSWDDFVSAMGPDGKPVMKCPGQIANGTYPTGDPFVGSALGVGNESRCYDGFHNWNQVQPAIYDGRYQFTTMADGKTPLPAGKYVVEMVLPPGYELVKEEDKNILMGDAFIAPVAQQFGGLSNIFITPDQAVVGAANRNSNNPNNNNQTTDLGHPTANINFPACVGAIHRVPDFMSLFPGTGQVAPFAGADRPLCDRKEVILADQMQANANFLVYTQAHIASHFTGIILDDASAEFNTASPDFGEKASVPYVPVSIRDWKGIEISRLHSDQFGTFNGLTPSSWEVNVPNPAGYSPNMLTTCMNDPGPISDGKGGLITDPTYNPNYSIFCYDNPFMPGLTDYLDTPLLPVAAYAAGYNPADCSYADLTPAIRRVDTSAGVGPYLTPAGGTVTLTSVGVSSVPNPNYGGPSATSAPANQKTIQRNYGFGATAGNVLLNGVPLAVTSWTDGSITATVPANTQTGELTVVAANGKSTVDGITLTLETKSPTRVISTGSGGNIQAALDAAAPGDLIILDAGTYNELAIMSKPVRLQGVGAPSVLINATKYPTNKLENWRPKINTLFGVDASGAQTLPAMVDPLPGQEITGGVVLLEPSVLGSEEGPGITVLAKNLGTNPGQNCSATVGGVKVYNFACYASRIDGLSVTGGDSGGGIFVNGWAHNLEISNNRVYGNAGAYNGGVRIGVPYLEDLALTGRSAGFAFNQGISIHNNAITSNGTVEANTGAGGAGGGISMCTGSDNYQVKKNFVCGNFTTGDGGGIGHIGVSLNGIIQNNVVQFNQSFAQGATVHGGGIIVEGEPAGAGGALSLGSGDVLVDANLVQGNFAEVGNGGGIRLQNVNGAEIARGTLYKVTVTNNMITNNMAGTAGGGIAMVDAVNSVVNNNTIVSNDSVSISGALFTVGPLTSSPHPAGVASEPTSLALAAALAQANSPLPANKRSISNPDLNNNIIWQNRSFFFDGSTGVDKTCSSNNTADATGHKCAELPAQSTSGQCVGTPAYWDLGVIGDLTATPGANALTPTHSILTNTTGYGNTNSSSDPKLLSQYCNGGRGLPSALHIFQLAAGSVEDEGGNFVDIRFGPLTPTGDYRIAAGSPAIDTGTNDAPAADFFGTKRPQGPGFDIGAHEYTTAPQVATLTPPSIAFGNVQLGQTSATKVATLTNTGTTALTGISISFASGLAQYSQTNNCGTSLAVGGSCSINIVLSPTLIAAARNTTLNVVDGAGTQTVALTGNGVAASATVTPSTLAFGTVKSKTTSAAKAVTLTNTGSGPISTTVTFLQFNIIIPVTPMYKLGASLPNACTGTLAPGASCTLNVVFAPTSTGSKPATMLINDGAGALGLSQTVNLTGTGN